MLLQREREEIVRACGELSAAGLVVGTAGNVSVRAGDLVAVTPSGVAYAELSAGDVGVHRLDGTPVEAPLAPTSELPLHLAVYGAYAGTAAVVHTHSVAATAVSTLADELPPVHYYVAMFGGAVRVAPYATYGTDELARTVVRALRGRTACLMGSHGAVTTGPDLTTARDRSVYLEWVCDVYLRAAAAGRPRLLPPGEIEAVAARLAGYGQRPRLPDWFRRLAAGGRGRLRVARTVEVLAADQQRGAHRAGDGKPGGHVQQVVQSRGEARPQRRADRRAVGGRHRAEQLPDPALAHRVHDRARQPGQ